MGDRLTMMWTDGVYDTFGPVDVVDNEYSKINYEKQLTKLGKYEDTGLEPDDIPTALEMANIYAMQRKLKHYEDLANQGRLLELPCKVGDGVWEVFEDEIIMERIVGISIGNVFEDEDDYEEFGDDLLLHLVGGCFEGKSSIKELGKTVFLTRPEAEQALAERQG